MAETFLIGLMVFVGSIAIAFLVSEFIKNGK